MLLCVQGKCYCCINRMRWNLCGVVYKASKISQWWACWCSLGCGPECILGLWPRIGVKHVAFYGLWPRMTSLELWVRIADEHEEFLNCGSSWRVLSV